MLRNISLLISPSIQFKELLKVYILVSHLLHFIWSENVNKSEKQIDVNVV